MNTEILIPADDSVRLLSGIVERMNLAALYATYSEEGRNEYSPRLLLKICVYGYSRKIISSRALERACYENLKFMYLLEGTAAPDHNTIARFRSVHLATVQDEMMQEMTRVLMDMDEVSFEKSAVFIDGTKIESVGNRYKFVWKKSVQKNYLKLQDQIRQTLPEYLNLTGIRFYVRDEIKVKHLKKLRKQICCKMEQLGIVRVYGCGHRKNILQKFAEKVEEWTARLKSYLNSIRICGDRNSYCKTDHEATFMRMKEDRMLNGQLKPGYNVNVATVSEYVVGTYVSADRSDVGTFIPFMEKLSCYPIRRVTVDSGYESEANYRYVEAHSNIDLYVKPSNFEQKKTRKYRTDISRRENMTYDAATDSYICHEGHSLNTAGIRRTKTASGYVSEKTIYECSNCTGCPVKEACIKSRSKTSLEDRNKRLEVSKYFSQQRDAMEEKISTEEGKQLRMNRSIQAEGVFAYTKTDLEFRRFMTKGTVKVGAEWTLLAMAYNILRLHHKAQNNRLGTHLFALKAI